MDIPIGWHCEPFVHNGVLIKLEHSRASLKLHVLMDICRPIRRVVNVDLDVEEEVFFKSSCCRSYTPIWGLDEFRGRRWSGQPNRRSASNGVVTNSPLMASKPRVEEVVRGYSDGRAEVSLRGRNFYEGPDICSMWW